jgi:hypothetical protein
VATDRNDQLLMQISGQLDALGGVLADIRDRLPVPAPAAGESDRIAIREPLPEGPPEPDAPTSTAATTPRKAAAKRRTTRTTETEA